MTTTMTDSQPTPTDTYLQPQSFPWRSLLLLLCVLAGVVGGYVAAGGIGIVVGLITAGAVAAPSGLVGPRPVARRR